MGVGVDNGKSLILLEGGGRKGGEGRGMCGVCGSAGKATKKSSKRLCEGREGSEGGREASIVWNKEI